MPSLARDSYPKIADMALKKIFDEVSTSSDVIPHIGTPSLAVSWLVEKGLMVVD